MNYPPYGTPEYYSNLFSDIIADSEHPEAIESILEGFELAINSWIEYHGSAHKHYRELMTAFQSVTSTFPPAHLKEQEEAAIPVIKPGALK